MSIAELQKSRVWLQLSDQQKVLLTEYLSTGLAQGRLDIGAAIQLAYPKIENKIVWASRLQGNPRIRAVLALYFGDPTQGLLDDVAALVKRSRRKNAQLDILVPYWIRAVAALEVLAAKTNAIQELSKDAT